MRRYAVRFRPTARSDLFDIYRYIRNESGYEIAGAYIDRIEAICANLAQFPLRGMRRDDLYAGARIVAIDRRVLIVYRVSRRAVVILRILYGGREMGALA